MLTSAATAAVAAKADPSSASVRVAVLVKRSVRRDVIELFLGGVVEDGTLDRRDPGGCRSVVAARVRGPVMTPTPGACHSGGRIASKNNALEIF